MREGVDEIDGSVEIMFYGESHIDGEIPSAHLYDDELPFWLAIGPICWRATYRKGWVWLPIMAPEAPIGVVYPGQIVFARESLLFEEYQTS